MERVGRKENFLTALFVCTPFGNTNEENCIKTFSGKLPE